MPRRNRVSLKYPSMNRTEARAKGLLVYNSGKKCEKKHDPTIRNSQTGRCMQCEKLYHEERLSTQRKRSRYNGNKPKYVYTMHFPDGTKICVGPFSTGLAAQSALERRWLVFYGVPFNYRFLPLSEPPKECIFEWTN